MKHPKKLDLNQRGSGIFRSWERIMAEKRWYACLMNESIKPEVRNLCITSVVYSSNLIELVYTSEPTVSYHLGFYICIWRKIVFNRTVLKSITHTKFLTKPTVSNHFGALCAKEPLIERVWKSPQTNICLTKYFLQSYTRTNSFHIDKYCRRFNYIISSE